MHNNKKYTDSKHNRLDQKGAPSLKIAAAAVICCGLSIGSVQAQPEPEPTSNADEKAVKVIFDSDECPLFVTDPFFELDVKKQIKRVKWEAYDQSLNRKDDIEFNVYFNPFVGPNSKYKEGAVTSPNLLMTGVPLNVTYKYTIMSKKCPHKPLDPYMRVR